MRGWVPPDDRLWRHPSESGGGSAQARSLRVARPDLAGRWIVGGATACLLLMVTATAVTMATTGQGDQESTTMPAVISVPTTEPGTRLLDTEKVISKLESNVRRSTVALVVTGAEGVVIGTGVVAESGGIIVTLDKVVGRARSITAVEPDGARVPASVVGTDPTTGIAVLHIGDDLPAAVFSESDPTDGATAVAISEWAAATGTRGPHTHLYAGTVVAAGQPMGGRALAGLAGTTVATPLTAHDLGCPLVDRSGHVWGILFGVTGPARSRTSVFLPAELVQDVIGQLLSSGQVLHGWLGVGLAQPARVTAETLASTTTSIPAFGTSGAVVDEVWPGSPAGEAGVLPGDVVVDIDDNPVHSAADLETRLYADPPGTVLDLTVSRNGDTLVTTAILASDGTDVQETASSP